MRFEVVSYDTNTDIKKDGAIFNANLVDLGDGSYFSQPSAAIDYFRELRQLPEVVSVTPTERLLVLAVGVVQVGATPDLISQNFSDRRDELAGIFDTSTGDKTPKVLVVEDKDNPGDFYEVDCFVDNFVYQRLTRIDVILAIPKWQWKFQIEETDTFTLPASGVARNIVVGGNTKINPVLEVTPILVRSGDGQKDRIFSRVINPTRANNGRKLDDYPLDIMNASFDTATEILATDMLANGDDIQVEINGSLVNFYIGNLDESTTRLWVNHDMEVGQEGKLKTAIAGAGSISTIELKKGKKSKRMMRQIPRRGFVLINNEFFSYNGKNVKRRRLKNIKRTIWDSTIAAHSVGDTVTWMQDEIMITWGNPSTDESINSLDAGELEPLFNLNTSTNMIWKYGASFLDKKDPRTASWDADVKAETQRGKGTKTREEDGTQIYTGASFTIANPADSMGMRIASKEANARFEAQTANLSWILTHPTGFTQSNITGQKAYNDGNWVQKAAILVSNDGEEWKEIADEPVPGAAAGAFEALTDINGVEAFSGTFRHVSIVFRGTIDGDDTTKKFAMMEITTLEMTIDTTNTPTVSIPIKKPMVEIDLEVEIQPTGQIIFVNTRVKLGNTFKMDFEDYDFFVDDTGSRRYPAVIPDGEIPINWFQLQGGVTNVLTITDAGLPANGLSVTTRWNKRIA